MVDIGHRLAKKRPANQSRKSQDVGSRGTAGGHFRAITVPIKQSRPDSGLGSHVKFLQNVKVFPSSLGDRKRFQEWPGVKMNTRMWNLVNDFNTRLPFRVNASSCTCGEPATAYSRTFQNPTMQIRESIGNGMSGWSVNPKPCTPILAADA